jgi:hypothetical protein
MEYLDERDKEVGD